MWKRYFLAVLRFLVFAVLAMVFTYQKSVLAARLVPGRLAFDSK